MPREGFKSITVPEGLYEELRRKAELYGTTVQNIIKIAASDGNFCHETPSEPQDLGSNPSGPAISPVLKLIHSMIISDHRYGCF
ncbi:MAG: hypothetical protein ABC585_08030 [Candidatus Methanosuratincola petrocarbonis]